jgi:hypothetical protein
MLFGGTTITNAQVSYNDLFVAKVGISTGIEEYDNNSNVITYRIQTAAFFLSGRKLL